MASCTVHHYLPPIATQRVQIEEGTEQKGRRRARKESNKQNQRTNPPPHVYPTGECEEGGPSRGTPWWPPQPLAYLLEFIVVHIIGVVLASFAAAASRVLFDCITLYCTEHSLQYGMLFLVIKDSFYLLQELQWLVHQACASLSGRSRTIAISITPPSCWKRAGRPSWSLSKIATALFSHIVRSHSSSARRVRAAFWGGACSRLGLPRLCAKRLFGGLAWWRFCSSLTVLSITSSETSLERVTFRLM